MHPLSCPFEFRVELALPFQISLVTAVILGIGGVDIGMVVAAVAVCSFWSGSIGLEPPHFPTETSSNTSKVETFQDDRDGDDLIAIVKIKGPKTPKCNSSTSMVGHSNWDLQHCKGGEITDRLCDEAFKVELDFHCTHERTQQKGQFTWVKSSQNYKLSWKIWRVFLRFLKSTT